MTSHRSFHFLIVILIILLGACGPQATPTAPPALDPTPPLEPINLAGPEMKVGSTFLYADGSLLVAVPGGIVTIGNGEAGDRPENPAHPVNISDFWIYAHKVTNRQYAYCVAMGGCTAPYGPENPGFNDYLHANDPVVGVDHSQATDYCTFVRARPPTEAEWEKAARGPDANIYPWGDAAPSCALLNFATCFGETTPVNAYPDGRSYYGAFDMEGNVLEWVADWYAADYYLESPADDPQGPDSGRARSVRSSAFNSGADQIPAFTRSFSPADTHRNNLGFRCVVEDPTYFAPFCTYPAVYGTDGIGGGPTGEQLQVNCPSISIHQEMTCGEYDPLTIVSFEGSGYYESWIDPLACFDYPATANPDDVICKYDATAHICTHCSVTLTVPAQCPDGYSYDAASMTCIGEAGAGECLPGYVPDEQTGGLCCKLDPGSPAPSTTPLVAGATSPLQPLHSGSNCPVGSWILTDANGNEVCIPLAVEDPYCKVEGVAYRDCTPEDVPCPPPPGGCGLNYAWDSNTCTCVCDGC